MVIMIIMIIMLGGIGENNAVRRKPAGCGFKEAAG